MNRISILGCGWLGMPLGKKLVELGFSVNGSTTRESKLNHIEDCGMTPFQIDLKNQTDGFDAFFKTEILIITLPPSNSVDPHAYFDQLELIKKNAQKSKVKHILFISSSSVYLNSNVEVDEKDASEQAMTRSGISLLEAEKIFESNDNTILRFSGLVGDDRHPGRWFAGKKNVKGGNVPVNMIHLDDCIGVIETIITGKYWGEIFNACSTEHPLKKEYYPILARELGLEKPQFDENDDSDWKIVSGKYFVEKSGYQYKRSIFDI
jgi:nucleoside-diphosphate-sugar epimerase